MKTVAVEYPMFYGATPDVFKKARELRKTETEPEKLLWTRLKENQLNGLQFRRQHPINRFIADFYCHKIKLVIEVDGGIHETLKNMEYDAGRSELLSGWGITVIRFSNNQITTNLEHVVEQIKTISKKLINEVPLKEIPPKEDTP